MTLFNQSRRKGPKSGLHSEALVRLCHQSRSEFFCPCPRGLEDELVKELASLDAGRIERTPGGVSFAGPFTLCYRVNLESRLASRVLWKVYEAPYSDEQDIYQMANSRPWPKLFSVGRQIKVKVSAQHCPLRSLDFVTLRIKDAICDKFFQTMGSRPSVNTHAPDIQIHAFLNRATCILYLDTSGDPLFKRGVRKTGGSAPLRENLAAGILKHTGWTPSIPLLDPMCGSGTFLLEAALIAGNISPGLHRRFAFEKFHNFDFQTWKALRQASEAKHGPCQGSLICGYDREPAALQGARHNLQAAGLLNAVHLEHRDVMDSHPPAEQGIIVTNPPYGIRSGRETDLNRLYSLWGNLLKERFPGWTAFILTADRQLEQLIRLKTSRRTPLFNGAVECRLFEFRIVRGSNRRTKLPPSSQENKTGNRNDVSNF